MGNKDTSVKNTTDKELNELILRLRKEKELYHKADKVLSHFGVKGMKWDVSKLKNKVEDLLDDASDGIGELSDDAKESLEDMSPNTEEITDKTKELLDDITPDIKEITKKVKVLLNGKNKDIKEITKKVKALLNGKNKDVKSVLKKVKALLNSKNKDIKSATKKVKVLLNSKDKDIKSATKKVKTLFKNKEKPNKINEVKAFLKSKVKPSKVEKTKAWVYNLLNHTETDDKVLSHFGISGMKWGRRKGSFKTTRVKSNNSIDYDRAQALKAKGIKNLSNDQINTLLKRINLEKQFRDVEVNKLKRGEDMARSILGIGTSVAGIYALSKTPLGEAIKAKFRR